MEAVENGYLEFRPTLAQRFWRALGYGTRWDEDLLNWRSADPEPGDWWQAGVLHSRVVVHVDWRDRLRLLISGRCQVDVYSRTDVLVTQSEARSVFAVVPPHG